MSRKPLKRDELKRATKKKKRKEGSRLAQPERYLIICEGKKTEPNYFKGIQKRINKKYDKKISERIQLRVKGTGRNTLSLLNFAKDQVKQQEENGILYNHIWLIYDLDDFPLDNFDNTAYSVESMNKNNNTSTKWHVAWSNQCIEIWFLLHFDYYNSDVHRTNYFKKLSKVFKKHGLDNYTKNNEDIFEILIEFGSLETAINNAKLLYREKKAHVPSKMAPATKVYELVELLRPHMF